jgi:hypothetical protein
MPKRLSNPSIRLLPFFAIFLLFLPHTKAEKPSQQISSNTDTNPRGDIPRMFDRETAGLRGPVSECTEERTTPAGEKYPEAKFVSIDKYDEQGRTVQKSTINTSGGTDQEFSTQFIYDAQGRLQKTIVIGPGQPAKESRHLYDDQGRESATLENNQPSATFEYGADGRKTRIAPTPPDAVNLYTSAISSSLIEGEEPYLPMPPGGRIKTAFDQAGRPVEWKIVDANGKVLNRLLRRYDAAGRLTDNIFTIETLPLSPVRDQLLENPDLTNDDRKMLSRPDFEEMAIAELLGPQKAISEISYVYDAQGRMIEKRERLGRSLEIVTAITYNEHSDKLREMISQSGDPNVPKGVSPGGDTGAVLPQRTERKYSYRYDAFGNWTEQAVTSADSAGPAIVTRRTLKYF